MMKKKIKWLVIGICVIVVAIVIYMGAVIRYVQREATTLNNYMASLEVLPEVQSVHTIHRFNGLESYVVALVELTNNQEAYFFVKDGLVEQYLVSDELITQSQAATIASNLIVGGEIQDTQLGIIEETPIFEVQMTLEDALYYVIIHALSGDVIMNFSL